METLRFIFALCCALLISSCKSNEAPVVTDDSTTGIVPVSFMADSAFVHIEKQCSYGARVPGSKAHAECATYIMNTFRRYGLQVSTQQTTVRGWDGKNLPCLNITASYLPDSSRRVVIATHWESRPWADQDPNAANHRLPVPAANDGASGVAVMLETARLLAELQPSVGVDFVCFDVEDYGTPYWGESPADGSDWCLGSQYWSTHLPEGYRPLYGILLDMVGGSDTHFRYEYFSRRYAEPIVAKVWGAAAMVGADDYFLPEDGTAATDDHIPMNERAGIPTIDIIGTRPQGFSETWHTLADTPQNISRQALYAVGQTLLQVLYEEK